MTIEKRLKQGRFRDVLNADYCFTEPELQDLLQQVAEEQRKICAMELYKIEGDIENQVDGLYNAPSPLKE